MCVDATDPMKGNWLRYVNWARSSEEQNLFPLEINKAIYYKVLRVGQRLTHLSLTKELVFMIHYDANIPSIHVTAQIQTLCDKYLIQTTFLCSVQLKLQKQCHLFTSVDLNIHLSIKIKENVKIVCF